MYPPQTYTTKKQNVQHDSRRPDVHVIRIETTEHFWGGIAWSTSGETGHVAILRTRRRAVVGPMREGHLAPARIYLPWAILRMNAERFRDAKIREDDVVGFVQ